MTDTRTETVEIREMAFPKIEAATAAEVCRDIELEEAALKLLAGDPDPAHFLERLLLAELYPDAIRFLSRALPKREAVWWAASCVQEATPKKAPDPELLALEAAARWIADPSEENRRAAMDRADANGYKSAADWAATAAAWSGGSLAPPDQAEVPPAEHLTSSAATSAIVLASVKGEAVQIPQTQRAFLESGLAVARGEAGWEDGIALGPGAGGGGEEKGRSG